MERTGQKRKRKKQEEVHAKRKKKKRALSKKKKGDIGSRIADVDGSNFLFTPRVCINKENAKKKTTCLGFM